ncbi:MAG: hypothetical protein ACK5JS_08125 [Mangrovibacterium sp.]
MKEGKFGACICAENEGANMFDDKFDMNVQYKINRRPRKILNFETPKDLFFKFVG